MQASSVGAYVGIKSAGERSSQLGTTAAALIAVAVLCGYAASCMLMLIALTDFVYAGQLQRLTQQRPEGFWQTASKQINVRR